MIQVSMITQKNKMILFMIETLKSKIINKRKYNNGMKNLKQMILRYMEVHIPLIMLRKWRLFYKTTLGITKKKIRI